MPPKKKNKKAKNAEENERKRKSTGAITIEDDNILHADLWFGIKKVPIPAAKGAMGYMRSVLNMVEYRSDIIAELKIGPNMEFETSCTACGKLWHSLMPIQIARGSTFTAPRCGKCVMPKENLDDSITII